MEVNMEDQIKEIMSNLFSISIDEIDDHSSPDTIEKWDSLGQLNLITSLEEEFDMMLTDDQIIEMLNFKLVVEVVKEAKGEN